MSQVTVTFLPYISVISPTAWNVPGAAYFEASILLQETETSLLVSLLQLTVAFAGRLGVGSTLSDVISDMESILLIVAGRTVILAVTDFPAQVPETV